ncbi:hypothetical protein ACJX0J_009932, partial [Zea mays]
EVLGMLDNVTTQASKLQESRTKEHRHADKRIAHTHERYILARSSILSMKHFYKLQRNKHLNISLYGKFL